MKQNNEMPDTTTQIISESKSKTEDIECYNLYDKIIMAEDEVTLKDLIDKSEDICILESVDSLFKSCTDQPVTGNAFLQAILNISEISDGYLTESLTFNFYTLFVEHPVWLASAVEDNFSNKTIKEMIEMALTQELEMSDNGNQTCIEWRKRIDNCNMDVKRKRLLYDLMPCKRE